jgi:hypothetical protein
VRTAPAGRCDCHEWRRIADIGSWYHRTGPRHLVLVRDWAKSGIWEEGRCRIGHAEMTSGIRAAGGITCDHALTGRKLLAGGVELVDGLHRWAVADELGIDLAPVAMSVEPGETESSWAWESGLFS